MCKCVRGRAGGQGWKPGWQERGQGQGAGAGMGARGVERSGDKEGMEGLGCQADLIHAIQQKSDIDPSDAQVGDHAGVGHLEGLSVPAQLVGCTFSNAHAPLPQHCLLPLQCEVCTL